jgi:hypothetical protein
LCGSAIILCIALTLPSAGQQTGKPKSTLTATPKESKGAESNPNSEPPGPDENAAEKDPAYDQPPPDFHEHVVVLDVYNLRHKTDDDSPGRRNAALNDVIVLRVRNLKELLDQSKCVGKDLPKGCRPRDIVLFLDGREIDGLRPESGAPKLEESGDEVDPDKNQTSEPNGELRYHLQRIHDARSGGPDNGEHWADLLGISLDESDLLAPRLVDISVGLAGDYPVTTLVTGHGSGPKFGLIRARSTWFVVSILISIAVIGLLIWLAVRSNLLRDRHLVLLDQKPPYSLSSFQAAWWFAIVFLCFIFIWLVTGQQDFSSTALILLSIGLGAALGGKVIDTNKRSSPADTSVVSPHSLEHMKRRKEALEAEMTDLNARSDVGNLKTKNEAYRRHIAEIRSAFPNAIGAEHKSFLTDILSDEAGVSFHRFQLFVWTIILGLFFVISALGRLAMPQFSETLLGLLGLSAGAYLGFKFPENNNGTLAPPDPAVDGSGTCFIEPAEGPTTGGQAVKISVPGFSSVKALTFGEIQVTNFTFDGSTIFTTTPTGPEGEVTVTVADDQGKTVQVKYKFIEP